MGGSLAGLGFAMQTSHPAEGKKHREGASGLSAFSVLLPASAPQPYLTLGAWVRNGENRNGGPLWDVPCPKRYELLVPSCLLILAWPKEVVGEQQCPTNKAPCRICKFLAGTLPQYLFATTTLKISETPDRRQRIRLAACSKGSQGGTTGLAVLASGGMFPRDLDPVCPLRVLGSL